MDKPAAAYRGNSPYVFVSYSHRDCDLVYEEIRSIQEQGINVWYDEGIDAGDEWSETLASAIFSCSNFVFFITPNSIQSEHCRRELSFANQHSLLVTAIHLVPSDLPAGMQLSLGNRQAVLKYNLTEDRYKEKVSAVLREDAGHLPGVAYSQPTTTPAANIADGRSGIAILPFVNRSSHEDIEFICEGIADEIITALSGISGLRVISSSSARQIDASRANLRAVGRQLNVQYILEGSVQKSGERLRITAKLPSTESDEILWANKWDALTEQIFDIQETIALGVVDALNIHLSAAESAQIVERPIPNVHAYEYYLRARQLIHTYTADALHQALAYLQQGEELIGENAHIIAAMGYVNWQFHNAGIDPDPRYMIEAKSCIDRLFALDPESPDGYRLSGLVNIKEIDNIQLSVNHLKIAVHSNPSDTDSLFWLPLLYGFAGKVSVGMVLVERLLKLDPLTSFHQIMPGFLNMLDGNLQDACPQLLVSHDLNPGNPITTMAYAQSLAMNDEYSKAKEVFALLDESVPDTFFSKLGNFYIYGMEGNREAALAMATEGLLTEAKSDLQYSWSLGQCFALIGEDEEAINWIENAVQYGFWNFPLLSERDRLLESLHSHKRYKALMADVKMKWTNFED